MEVLRRSVLTRTTVRTALAALLVVPAGCGQAPDDSASSTPDGPVTASALTPTDAAAVADTALGRLPVARTGDDAVTLLDAMPKHLGDWAAAPSARGQALYEHPAGPLGIEAGELADIYARPVTAAQAVRLFRHDLDGGRGRRCAEPPAHCITGALDGATALVWTHDDSEVLLVALWPNAEARDRLLDAWIGRLNPVGGEQ
jgi:hypothetical protein